MNIRFEVNQAEAFRRGINCDKSIVHLNVDPSKLPKSDRDLIADRLVGIDIVQIFAWRGQRVKGWPVPGLNGLDEPCRIIADLPEYNELMEAIRKNEKEVSEALRADENRKLQTFRLDTAPADQSGYTMLRFSDPSSEVDLVARLRRSERVGIDELGLERVQGDLAQLLIRQRYAVKLLPIPGKTTSASFYFDPPNTVRFRYRATFLGKEVAGNTEVVLYNERTGTVAEMDSLGQALALYLRLALQPRLNCNEFSILRWEGDHWVIIPPEVIKVARISTIECFEAGKAWPP